MRERDIERHLVKRVKELGGEVRMTDRMLCAGCGRLVIRQHSGMCPPCEAVHRREPRFYAEAPGGK